MDVLARRAVGAPTPQTPRRPSHGRRGKARPSNGDRSSDTSLSLSCRARRRLLSERADRCRGRVWCASLAGVDAGVAHRPPDGPHADVEEMVVKYAEQSMALTVDYQAWGKGNLFEYLQVGLH